MILILRHISEFEERHPYILAFCFSVTLISMILFISPMVFIADQSESIEAVHIIDYSDISVKKHTSVKDIIKEESDAGEESIPEKATGTSLEESAVDLAFSPNVAPPRLISKLKKNYPRMAKEQEVEALVDMFLVVSESGEVKIARVEKVTLSKDLPPETAAKLKHAFSTEAVKSLMQARFSPPIVNGRNVPLKMIQRLRYRLEDY